MFFVRLLLASIVMTVCFATFASGALEVLPADEVQALHGIFNTLGMKSWESISNPCYGNGSIKREKLKEPAVVMCSKCTYVNGTESYGIVRIYLKRHSLSGTLPPDLVKLPCLKFLDLTLNYLYGSIPSAWGSMPKLAYISLLGNRLTGPIPRALANIKTLKGLTVEFNQLSGNLPPELGTLSSIERMRISDLNEYDSAVTFPLKNINVTQWQILILRNCNLTGPLPHPFLSPRATRNLSTLDLSFNRLSGEIPSSFGTSLGNVERIYLTRNLFTGQIPDWILNGGKKIDLSYNKFTFHEGSDHYCQIGNGTNLFASSSMDNIETSNIVSCLRSLPRCPKHGYKLHINCGGNDVIVNESIKFDADKDPGGPSNFFLAQGRGWSSSSTGQFIGDARPKKAAFILSNLSRLSTDTPDAELYMTARFSPLSLTYYAFCLVSGNYRVRLHFAEIVFTDDETYSSLGRRIFDVYIQGKRVLKDFDIVKAAGGVRKPYIQSFNVVVRTNSTLEIRFYWAGKGTTDIPTKGEYGPLISAITVDSDDEPSSLPRGAVVGIIIAGVFVIILFIVAILWWKGCLGERSSAIEHDLRGLDLKTGTFTLRQIKTATNSFDVANKIGEGGFGSVYKGLLSDGTMMAVKQLSSKSNQGNREFLNEIGMISALQHPHLVKLYGCCVEGNQLLLVYEYMEKNSLARALFVVIWHLSMRCEVI
ncbi:hypothetical protein I3760_12G108400 [Carya illinoinensis]|nr:hypothetical protein I3760_12G108400 [Carya illinoinensis]